ncbi:hypothetical protein CDD81_7865 [Ophiocordyceps australis]|uniref:Aminotransferase class V domain-containing protein n=1 Tax=Ophiocordyceps australis TaxID=1399860 RepID=A0A2C5YG45_9HYPO|nr:hypothetical protein CDD81_7865 [Ophiocordyceps australis]
MDIRIQYPEYRKTQHLDELRATQYRYLDDQGHVYLDYTGAGLASTAQHRAREQRLASATFGNPHSMNPTSQSSTDLIEQTRQRILEHMNASPAEYAVIFAPNATGAARLVGESYPFTRHSRLVLTQDNHNSILGLREFARHAGAKTCHVPARAPDLRIDTTAMSASLPRPKRCGFSPASRCLLAYPAQSNFSGVRHPLSWIKLAQKRGYDVLLDAAAYLPTAELDLSTVKPDFVLVSWYKLFGSPTGVGCLIARHSALARLRRPWFSGGTIQAVTVGFPWHEMATDESAFEDGTLNYLSIPDVSIGLDILSSIGISTIGTRVRCLTGWCIDRMQAILHGDGSPVVRLYGPTGTQGRGGTIAFNLLDAHGKVVDERIVGRESAAAGISLRTGCFCNPGAGEVALGVTADAIRRATIAKAKAGQIDPARFFSLLRLPTGGAIRISFGIASNTADVDFFIAFVAKTYCDRVTTSEGLEPRGGC